MNNQPKRTNHPDLYGDPEDTLTRSEAEALVDLLVERKLAAMASSGTLPAGPKGDPLTWDDLTDEQKASLKGEPGNDAETGNVVNIVFNDESDSEGDTAEEVLAAYVKSQLRSDGYTISQLAASASAAVSNANAAATSANGAASSATGAASSATAAATRATNVATELENVSHNLLRDAYAQYLPAIVALRQRISELERDYGRYLNQIRSASGNARLKVFDTNFSDSDSDSDSDVPGIWNGSVVLEYVSLGNTFKLTPTNGYNKIKFGNGVNDAVTLPESGVSFGGSVQVINGFSCYGEDDVGKFRLHDSNYGWRLIYCDNNGDHALATVASINKANPLVEWDNNIIVVKYSSEQSRIGLNPSLAPKLVREYASYQRSVKLDAGVHITEDNVTDVLPDYVREALVNRGPVSSLPPSARTGDMYRLTADSGSFLSGDLVAWYDGAWTKIGTTAASAVPSAEMISVPNQNQEDHTFLQGETVRSALLAIISRCGIALHPSGDGHLPSIADNVYSINQALGVPPSGIDQYFRGHTVWECIDMLEKLIAGIVQANKLQYPQS